MCDFHRPFIFIALQIPFPANHFFSQRSELPGGIPQTPHEFRFSSFDFRPYSCVFIHFQTLCRAEKTQVLSFQQNPNSFCKTPGVGWPLRPTSARALELRDPRSIPARRTGSSTSRMPPADRKSVV